MTKKDLKRYGVINDLVKGNYTVEQASKLLNISSRQVLRLKKNFTKKGVDGIIHKSRGKKPNNSKPDELVKRILELKRDFKYEKANFTHFKELLKEYENIDISYSCLYSILNKNGIKSPKKHKRVKLTS